MQGKRFQRIQRLYYEARRLSRADRADFLERACKGDEPLREEVLSLLDASAEFMDTPALGDSFDLRSALSDAGPKEIGQYRIIERLGDGGMGVVYKALQSKTGSVVALKVIRPGIASQSIIRRFELEAQALGKLRHSGIARVYEAGIHQSNDHSTPFIAMELIEGPSLIDYASRASLESNQILEVFVLLCDAVQHAHQQGVIHRDLKPGNILIDESGTSPQPKILDFGIARITDADTLATTQFTHTGQLIGTVQYMSPEQASGDPSEIDTRSDVYALGVILYELLAHRMPYTLDQKLIHEALRVIREDDAAPLSSISRTFKGDLTTVLGKALEKEKSRRYQSASEFGADLQRFLRDEPIAAHPDSAVYQLRKFARRNRGLVVGTAVAFALLITGIITTSWQAAVAARARDEAQLAKEAESRQRRKAENRFNEVRQLARTLIFDLEERIRQLPGSVPARELLVTEAMDYLQSVARDLDPSDVQMQGELSAAYFKLGNVQGDVRTASLGDRQGALNSYKKGLGYARTLAKSHPDDLRLQIAYAKACNKIGEHLQIMGESKEADTYHDKALKTLKAVNQSHPDQRKVLRELGQSLAILAEKHRRDVGLARAIETSRDSVSTMRAAVALEDSDTFTNHALASSNSQLAEFLEQEGSLREALLHRQETLAIIEAILAREPHSAVYQKDLGRAAERVGYSFQLLGEHDRALPYFQRADETLRKLMALDDKDKKARYSQIVALLRIGESQLALNRLEEASESFKEHLSRCRQYAAAFVDDPAAQRLVAVAFYKLAEIGRANGDRESLSADERARSWREACDRLSDCLEVFLRLQQSGMLGSGDANVPDELRLELASCRQSLEELR